MPLAVQEHIPATHTPEEPPAGFQHAGAAQLAQGREPRPPEDLGEAADLAGQCHEQPRRDEQGRENHADTRPPWPIRRREMPREGERVAKLDEAPDNELERFV
jgi:hypothetical protein